jgi:hypothetical protein
MLQWLLRMILHQKVDQPTDTELPQPAPKQLDALTRYVLLLDTEKGSLMNGVITTVAIAMMCICSTWEG